MKINEIKVQRLPMETKGVQVAWEEFLLTHGDKDLVGITPSAGVPGLLVFYTEPKVVIEARSTSGSPVVTVDVCENVDDLFSKDELPPQSTARKLKKRDIS